MAKIIRRAWTSAGRLGRKVKHVAYGYTLTHSGGQRERKVSSAWLTESAALDALNARLKAIAAGQLDRPAERTLGEVAEEYLAYKRNHGKRSLKDDERILRNAAPSRVRGGPARAAAPAEAEGT